MRARTLAAGEVVERQGVGCAPCKAGCWRAGLAVSARRPAVGAAGRRPGHPRARKRAWGGSRWPEGPARGNRACEVVACRIAFRGSASRGCTLPTSGVYAASYAAL